MRALKQDGGLLPAIHYFSPLSHSQRDDSQPLGPSGLKSEATKGGPASLHFPPPAPCHAASCPQKKRTPRKFFWIISMLITLRMLWWQGGLGISFPLSGWLLNQNTYVPQWRNLVSQRDTDDPLTLTDQNFQKRVLLIQGKQQEGFSVRNHSNPPPPFFMPPGIWAEIPTHGKSCCPPLLRSSDSQPKLNYVHCIK